MVMGIIKDAIAKNLRHPKSGPVGWFVSKYVFEDKNRYLEKNAVDVCKISKDDIVLEVGFGPGIGLKEAHMKIKDGKGKVYGVEISQAMLKKASHSLQTEIKAGKVELILADVAKLPFKSDMFDHVFHCNCYYFWDDQVACARELYRVMKQNANVIAVMNEQGLKVAEQVGVLKYGNTDPFKYMDSLKKAGFHDIEFKKLKSARGHPFSAIFAKK
ncbi:uncharacterized methyltransferase YdaC-like [Saccostrea echinata]|uniref:uncharacterized methyltransferase YdaC-like n=1 Tax=Saccostrea echinata TaxID=191078 RepID=UPI002A807893|nr:uncharacterized methyltransferase YdaC-like [Saccostrea echinata]